jgi:OFA family oxalate/formate antiporter-like MFS transporter
MYRRSSPRFVCMICDIILSASLYMSSYSDNYSIFAGMYGLIAGILLGFLYIYPLAHFYIYFLDRKAFISGFIISVSCLGTLIFAFMAFNTINPRN